MDRLNQLISLLPNNLVGGSVCIYTATHLINNHSCLNNLSFSQQEQDLSFKKIYFFEKIYWYQKNFLNLLML